MGVAVGTASVVVTVGDGVLVDMADGDGLGDPAADMCVGDGSGALLAWPELPAVFPSTIASTVPTTAISATAATSKARRWFDERSAMAPTIALAVSDRTEDPMIRLDALLALALAIRSAYSGARPA